MNMFRCFILFLTTAILVLTACAPSPEANVAGYLIAKQFGTLDESNWGHLPTGTLTGQVVDQRGEPIKGATVVVAMRTGQPFVGQSDDTGTYTIENVPQGKYVPAAVAPGYDEIALHDRIGVPTVVEVIAGTEQFVPLIHLSTHEPLKLPNPLARTINLSQTSAYTATAPFPADSEAQVTAFTFEYNDAVATTLRLYLPNDVNALADEELPLLFMVYPTHVDLWQTVSTAYAAQGYALVALSPLAERAVDIDAHAADALVALTLATSGELTAAAGLPDLKVSPQAVALGGSFSSAILNRLLRDSGDKIMAWTTVGGIGNAFAGTADFYAERITIPSPYELLIPALGSPRLYPLPFLRYSPVYVAGAFPPTQIIHTDADRVIPISQAKELEQALRSAGVPVDVFYYEDVSHYLQIDENLSEAGQEMFVQVLNFVEKQFEE